ncbi:MAG: polysaccharide biosynthesis/export family protein, partial [Hyphomicrobiales bacterium]|nr:polysaccharide biosynthesis/export family protein [Hyphomicrobiales bacterium]
MGQSFVSARTGRQASIATALLAVFAFAPGAAWAEYKLHSGDTLEISVTGVPDLRERAPIAVGGEIALPIGGQLQVGGLLLSEARAKIAESLANKLYQQTTADGREIQHLIAPDTIVVAVAEYRPIYVDGDVARPGELVFRPGMTVRQAIATAGGYDLVQFRMVNPIVQAADFRSDYETLWAQYAMEQARIWRLRTELGEQSVEYGGNDAPVSAEFANRLKQDEAALLAAHMADRERDKALLREAIGKADGQLETLAEKKKKDDEGNQADAADFEKARALTEKGMSTAARLADTRRAVLLSSDQLLQTVVEMSNVDRQRSEFVRQLDKIDSQAHIDAWRDLQESNVRLAEINARLRSAGDKLVYTNRLPSQLMPGSGARPNITVHRMTDDGPQNLTADENLALAPGDVVDIALEAKTSLQALNPPPIAK